MKNKVLIFMCIVLVFGLVGCNEEVIPKPKAMLRLEFPDASQGLYINGKFSFTHNIEGQVHLKNEKAITIDYPQMKASIFLSYKSIENNLNQLLLDAQKLSYEHAAKADNILEQPFVNHKARVYGMFYDVKGDAASQAQFYVTDSTKHFLTGSLYFNIKPNYDSIYPAAVYLQNDIRDLMESLRWKE